MTIELDLQLSGEHDDIPADEDFHRWVGAALAGHETAELTIRIVDREESHALNHQYRGKDRPTNVLSFPAELPPGVDIPLLGDIVICAPLVAEEASEQEKTNRAHWAHLTVHGVLHLLGHDHQADEEAEEMERLEISILHGLGFADPYEMQK